MLRAFILMLKLKGSEGGEIDAFKYQIVFNEFTKRVRIYLFITKNLDLFDIRRDISWCAICGQSTSNQAWSFCFPIT